MPTKHTLSHGAVAGSVAYFLLANVLRAEQSLLAAQQRLAVEMGAAPTIPEVDVDAFIERNRLVFQAIGLPANEASVQILRATVRQLRDPGDETIFKLVDAAIPRTRWVLDPEIGMQRVDAVDIASAPPAVLRAQFERLAAALRRHFDRQKAVFECDGDAIETTRLLSEGLTHDEHADLDAFFGDAYSYIEEASIPPSARLAPLDHDVLKGLAALPDQDRRQLEQELFDAYVRCGPTRTEAPAVEAPRG